MDKYGAIQVEELLETCFRRIPRFSVTLNVFPKPMGVSVTWNYDLNSELFRWARTRTAECFQGGTYPTIRDCLVAILSRVDRFDAWVQEQYVATKNAAEAAARANRASAAAPREVQELDEGDEEVPAEKLEPVIPLPEDALSSVVPVDDKLA